MEIKELMTKMWELATVFGLKLLAAIAVFVFGRWVAMALKDLLRKMMEKAKIDETLTAFIGNLAYIALMTIVIIAALGQLGVQTTSFVAILGAAGLAVGLALQSSLSNFASGVMMIFFRPIKVGDLIEAAGVFARVKEIQIFNTVVITMDNKTVIIPNSKITADKIVNYSTQGNFRLEMPFTIEYGEDLGKIKAAISEVLQNNPKVMKDPAPIIGIKELVGGNAKVMLAVRLWIKPDDHWSVWFDVNEAVKQSFDAKKLNLPPAPPPAEVILKKEA